MTTRADISDADAPPADDGRRRLLPRLRSRLGDGRRRFLFRLRSGLGDGRHRLLPRLRSGLGIAFWVAIPAVSILMVAGYFASSVALGTTPPFAVVSGQSMRPAHSPGDLVVIKALPTHEIEVGDVVAILTPADFVEERGFPRELVHRVIDITRIGGFVEFTTKGDNNPQADPFRVFPDNIRGKVIAHYPGLGYPVLFFRSSQGLIFLSAFAIAVIGYFLIAAIERRQEAAELESPRVAMEYLAEETHSNGERLEELVGAVSEYGEHLRSHTEILRSMSAASQSLAAVTERLGRTVSTLREPDRAAALIDYLAEQAYAEWSLVVPDRAAVAIGRSRAEVLSEFARLGILGRLEVRALQPPDLYRYRLQEPHLYRHQSAMPS